MTHLTSGEIYRQFKITKRRLLYAIEQGNIDKSKIKWNAKETHAKYPVEEVKKAFFLN